MADVYGDRIAPITYYTGSSDPFYTTEGYSRWHSYPPPYRYGSSWVYAWPWLWLDGDKHPGYQYATWEGYLQARLPVPSDLEIDLGGSYEPGSRSGSLEITIENVGSVPLTGTLQCVLTESELYYVAPNGLDWHHHVMRDMIPTDAGTSVTLPPGEPTVVTLGFELDPAWVADECKLICFVQHEVLQPDSTKEIWQGAKVAVLDLTGSAAVETRPQGTAALQAPAVLQPMRPNPARPATEVTFELAGPAEVSLDLFDIAGRKVRVLAAGRYPAGAHTMVWNGTGGDGLQVPAGIYYCRLEARADGVAHEETRTLLVTR